MIVNFWKWCLSKLHFCDKFWKNSQNSFVGNRRTKSCFCKNEFNSQNEFKPSRVPAIVLPVGRRLGHPLRDHHSVRGLQICSTKTERKGCCCKCKRIQWPYSKNLFRYKWTTKSFKVSFGKCICTFLIYSKRTFLFVKSSFYECGYWLCEAKMYFSKSVKTYFHINHKSTLLIMSCCLY